MAAASSGAMDDLIQAARLGNVSALNAAGTDELRRARDKEKRGVLHHAALGGHVEGLESLLDRGLDINDRTAKGLTPVHLAVHAGSLPCLQLLAKRGADVKSTDRAGRSPLTVAVVGGHKSLAEVLRGTYGLDPRDRNDDGMDALHFACLGGDLDTCKWCVEHGCSPRQQTGAGWAPLHYAAARGHMEVATWLLDEQSAPHSPADESGVTPLHLAATGPSEVVLISLLRAGADPNRKDTRGHTPLSLAAGRPASSKGTVAGTAASATALMREAIATPSAPPRPTIVLLRAGVLGVEFEAPMCGPAAPPTEGLQVERAQRGMLGLGSWVEVDEGTLDPTATSTELGFVKPEAVLAARVRARNRNGWGAWSANSEETSLNKLVDASKAGAGWVESGGGKSDGGAVGAGAHDPSPDAGTSAQGEAGAASNGAAAGTRRQRDRLDEAAARAAASGDVAGLAEAEQRGVNVLTGVWAPSGEAAEAFTETEPATASAEAAAGGGPSADDTVSKHAGLRRTALHMAVSEGHAGAARWLARRALEQLGDEKTAVALVLEARDAKGATPMLLAVVGGHVACARVLAGSGASLDTCDLKGFSALHYAAHKGQTRLFCWLLESGADPDARTKSGKTVESMASSMRAAAAMLSSARAPPPAPAPPVFLAASRYALAIELPALRLAPGCPRPLEVELSYGPKFSLLGGSVTLRVPYEATRSETRGEEVSGMRELLSALTPDTVYSIRSRARSVRGWGTWCTRPLEVSTRPSSDRRGIPPGMIRGRGRAGDTESASGLGAPGTGSPAAAAMRGGGGSRLGQLMEAEDDGDDAGSVGSPVSSAAARFGMGLDGGAQLGAPASIVLDGPPIADVPGMLAAHDTPSYQAGAVSPDAWLGRLAPRVEASLLRDARTAIVAVSDALQRSDRPAAPSHGDTGSSDSVARAGLAWGAVARAWSPKTLLQSCGPALRRARRSVLRRAALGEAGALTAPAKEDAAESEDAVIASICVSSAAAGAPTVLCWAIGLRARDLIAPHTGSVGVHSLTETLHSAADRTARSDSDADEGLPSFGAEAEDAKPVPASAAAGGEQPAGEIDFVSGGAVAAAQATGAAARASRRRTARLRRGAAVLRMVLGGGKHSTAMTVAMAAAAGPSAEPQATLLPANILSAVTIAMGLCLAAGADPSRFVQAVLVTSLLPPGETGPVDAPVSTDPAAALTEEAESAAVLSAMASVSAANASASETVDCGGLAHSAAYGASLSALQALDVVAHTAGFAGGSSWCAGEVDSRGATALHYAAAARDAAGAVASLASAHAPSLPEDAQGRSPAHWAAAAGRAQSVAALLGAVAAGAGGEEAGRTAAFKAATRADGSGVTPLHVAASAAAASSLVLLLSAVASSTPSSATSLSAVQRAVTTSDDAGRTTLSIAAATGDATVLAVLRGWLQPAPACTRPKLDSRPHHVQADRRGDEDAASGAAEASSSPGAAACELRVIAYRLLSEGTSEAIGDASDSAAAASTRGLPVGVLPLAPVTGARIEMTSGGDGSEPLECEFGLEAAEKVEAECGAWRCRLELTSAAAAGPAAVKLTLSGHTKEEEEEDDVCLRIRLRTGAGWSAWSAWSSVLQQ